MMKKVSHRMILTIWAFFSVGLFVVVKYYDFNSADAIAGLETKLFFSGAAVIKEPSPVNVSLHNSNLTAYSQNTRTKLAAKYLLIFWPLSAIGLTLLYFMYYSKMRAILSKGTGAE